MNVEAFLPFLLATIVGCVVAVTGYWFARKAGLGPLQAEYVDTLKEINTTLDAKLKLMQEKLDTETGLVAELQKRVLRLERTIVDLTSENTDLKGRLRRSTDHETP